MASPGRRSLLSLGTTVIRPNEFDILFKKLERQDTLSKQMHNLALDLKDTMRQLQTNSRQKLLETEPSPHQSAMNAGAGGHHGRTSILAATHLQPAVVDKELGNATRRIQQLKQDKVKLQHQIDYAAIKRRMQLEGELQEAYQEIEDLKNELVYVRKEIQIKRDAKQINQLSKEVKLLRSENQFLRSKLKQEKEKTDAQKNANLRNGNGMRSPSRSKLSNSTSPFKKKLIAQHRLFSGGATIRSKKSSLKSSSHEVKWLSPQQVREVINEKDSGPEPIKDKVKHEVIMEASQLPTNDQVHETHDDLNHDESVYAETDEQHQQQETPEVDEQELESNVSQMYIDDDIHDDELPVSVE